MVHIFGRGSERDPAALRLYTTCNRNYVENERPDEERPIEALQAAYQYVKSISPSARCCSLTAMYNCVGVVFASRRTHVDCEHLDMILQDDGYRLISQKSAIEGDVVVYRKDGIPLHVGIIYELQDLSFARDGSQIELWVLSQWGQDGEYIHKLREVSTLYGDQLEFWTERRPVT